MRGCQLPLAREPRTWCCARGHRFDIAREGHVNLLQPQDRRSREPGDSAAARAGRSRFLAAGHAAPMVAALRRRLPPERSALLDVGTGDASLLAGVVADSTLEVHGLDLSAAAVAVAARRMPEGAFVVANADRNLPYAEGSFDCILSITSRRNPAQMQRVLRGHGRLLVVVPAPDDLIELRAAIQPEGRMSDRTRQRVEELAAHFREVERERITLRIRAEPATQMDALAMTYRGGRERERKRAGTLVAMDLTLSWDLLCFSPLAENRGKITDN